MVRAAEVRNRIVEAVGGRADGLLAIEEGGWVAELVFSVVETCSDRSVVAVSCFPQNTRFELVILRCCGLVELDTCDLRGLGPECQGMDRPACPKSTSVSRQGRTPIAPARGSGAGREDTKQVVVKRLHCSSKHPEQPW